MKRNRRPRLDLDRIASDARLSLDLEDETAVALVFLDGHEKQLAVVIDDVPDDVREIASVLGAVLDHGDFPPVVVVRPRLDGRARPDDAELLRLLQSPLRATPVLALLAVGREGWEQAQPYGHRRAS